MKLLVLASAATLSGCLLKPDKVELQQADARVQMDAPAQTLDARLVRNAYFDNGTAQSTGMSSSGYQIATQGINPGDLVLFIANIDNGSDTVWMAPDNFSVVRQKFFGTDGQTFIVAWHIAGNSEPAIYTKAYGPGINSASATISLIAIAGADPTFPINTYDTHAGSAAEAPVIPQSNGVTTTVPACLLVYAAGADWLGSPGSNTTEVPMGFSPITSLGDNGDQTWSWTSQVVAVKFQPAAGPSGVVSGKLTGTVSGIPWTALLAIAPAPS